MTAPQPRPEPAPRLHDLTQHKAILVELLQVERQRLAVALRIEAERSIVFPETTVIIKDIQRLSLAILGKPEDEPEPPTPEGDPGGQGDEFDFLRSL